MTVAIILFILLIGVHSRIATKKAGYSRECLAVVKLVTLE